MKKVIKTKFEFSLSIVLILFFATACNGIQKDSKELNDSKTLKNNERNNKISDTIYQSKNLILVKLSDHTYQHISFLNTNDFGKVSCNGMVVINDGQSIIFDTPANDESSEELIKFVTKNLKSTILGVIPTHFHQDCVGGISIFNKHKIQSYASNRTIQFLKKKSYKYAGFMKSFKDSLKLNIGNKIVIAKYFGEGHTKDNIIGYFPTDNVMFGGCLIKELGATKGNIEDANIEEWPHTVLKLEAEYPKTEIVIPGHGKSGEIDLLKYTVKLFK